MEHVFDVTQSIDRQRVGPMLLGVLAMCIAVTIADGYNISVAAFAGPAIVRDWHLSKAALGPLFSASLVAGLIGPYLFGSLGDRIGRRNAIIISTLMIGCFGLISGWCTSITALIGVRFVAGIGMSGALAVTVAYINEFAPRRLRATFVTITFSGTTIGSGLPGVVAPALLAHHSWQTLFFLGGIVPLVLAGIVLAVLPESPKFLCLRPGHEEALVRVLQRIDPRFAREPRQRFTLSGEIGGGPTSHRQFFTAHLKWLTPLLWLGAFIAMIVYQSFISWLPTLLTDSGLPFARASFAMALFQFAGTLGGWMIMRPLDRFGMIPCTILYLLSIPMVVSLGAPGLAPSTLLVLVSLSGVCLLGLHFAQVFCVSSIYPTPVRAMGVGFFMLFARVGGALGPAIVGILVTSHVTLRNLYYLATIPLALGTLASLAVTLLYRRHYQGRTDGTAEPGPTAPLPAVAMRLKSGTSFDS